MLKKERTQGTVTADLGGCGVAQAAESDASFSILQPGSSVATALSEGESKKKHVVLLEILGDQWRTFKYPLRTVRPFTFDQVSRLACIACQHVNLSVHVD